MASMSNFATAIVCVPLASMSSSACAAMAESKSSPACPGPAVKISKTGKPSCATCSNAACAASSSWCKMIFPDYSPSPRACSPTPTSNSAPCIGSAMQKPHLSKTDAAEFQQRWRAIKSSWNLEVANQQFEQLCDRFAKTYSTFIGELRKKRQHYLAFLNYPESIRRSLSTTNVVEAVNGQLEIMRRNSGGYFHSEDILKLKLGLAVSSLEQGRWKAPGRSICSVLRQFNAMFQSHFEAAA